MVKINYTANDSYQMLKKAAISLAFFIFFVYASGNCIAGKNDKWLDCGLRGSFNSTWLINSNVINDKYLNYDFSFGYAAGVKLGFNFSEALAIGVEGLYSQYTQKYKSNTPTLSWKNEVQINAIEIPVLFKYTNEFSYVEIGPQLLMIQKAGQSFSGSAPLGDHESDVASIYTSPHIGLAFGFGSIIWATGGLSIATGLRLNYYFTDLINEKGGQGLNYPNPPYPGYPAMAPAVSYKSTNLGAAGIMISIDYDLGYVVTSSCKRSRKFVFFSH
jgi:hypothetical protein